MTGEEARDVFEEDSEGSVLSHKVEEGEGEAAAGPLAVVVEAAALPGDGEVLAGEAAGPEEGVAPVITAGLHPIACDGTITVGVLS